MYPDLRAAGAEVVGPVAPEFPRRPAAALPSASPGGVGGDRPFRRCPPRQDTEGPEAARSEQAVLRPGRRGRLSLWLGSNVRAGLSR